MKPRLHAALACLLVFAVRCVYFDLVPQCAEDAYITFHAAMDPAWRQAATSPLWALWVGIIRRPEFTATITLLAVEQLALISLRQEPKVLWTFAILWCLPFYNGSALAGMETHLAACALVAGFRHRAGLTLAAALRPDTALLAFLVAGRKHWRWAVAGALVMVGLNLWFSGGPLPSTASAKAQVYGWKGLTYFWWYAVAPSAVAIVWIAKRIRLPWKALLPLTLGLFAALWPHQMNRLMDRSAQEGKLYDFGAQWAKMGPTGTVLMEPAGIIPYHCGQMQVIDEIGLVTPWVTEYRKRGPGWYVDIVREKRPEWLVMRVYDLLNMNGGNLIRYSGGIPPARSTEEWNAMLSEYRPALAPGLRRTANDLVEFDGRSSTLVALRRITP